MFLLPCGKPVNWCAIAQIFSVLSCRSQRAELRMVAPQARDPSGGSCSVPALVAKRR